MKTIISRSRHAAADAAARLEAAHAEALAEGEARRTAELEAQRELARQTAADARRALSARVAAGYGPAIELAGILLDGDALTAVA